MRYIYSFLMAMFVAASLIGMEKKLSPELQEYKEKIEKWENDKWGEIEKESEIYNLIYSKITDLDIFLPSMSDSEADKTISEEYLSKIDDCSDWLEGASPAIKEDYFLCLFRPISEKIKKNEYQNVYQMAAILKEALGIEGMEPKTDFVTKVD